MTTQRWRIRADGGLLVDEFTIERPGGDPLESASASEVALHRLGYTIEPVDHEEDAAFAVVASTGEPEAS